MQSFIVLACLVSELAAGGGGGVKTLQKHLSPLRVKLFVFLMFL